MLSRARGGPRRHRVSEVQGWVQKRTQDLEGGMVEIWASEESRSCVSSVCWKERYKESPRLQVGAGAWERGEGGAGRGMWPLLRSGTPPPPLSTRSRDGLLPERPMSPRPRAAQRPSSARSSPGKGPGIAAAGRGPEEREARARS